MIASGAWVPLAFGAGFAGFCHTAARPRFVDAIERRLYPTRMSLMPEAPQPSDGVGPVVAGPIGRIAIMQVAVIIGAMLSRSYGSEAPLLIMIGLKTLFGFQRGAAAPTEPLRVNLSTGGTHMSLDVGQNPPHSSPE